VTARPLSLNPYAWVEGNVVNATDPSGQVMAFGKELRPVGAGSGGGGKTENKFWEVIKEAAEHIQKQIGAAVVTSAVRASLGLGYSGGSTTVVPNSPAETYRPCDSPRFSSVSDDRFTLVDPNDRPDWLTQVVQRDTSSGTTVTWTYEDYYNVYLSVIDQLGCVPSNADVVAMTLATEIGTTWADFSGRPGKVRIFGEWAENRWMESWEIEVQKPNGKICYVDGKLGVRYPNGQCTLPHLLIEAVISNQYQSKCGSDGCDLRELMEFIEHNAVWRDRGDRVDTAASKLIENGNIGISQGFGVGSEAFSAAIGRIMSFSPEIASLTTPRTWGNSIEYINAQTAVLVDSLILFSGDWYLRR
jgi:hypothetical protein